MAHMRYASELMTNFFSAVAVPKASHIASVWEPETRQPIVFTLSNDEVPKLQMIRTNAEGRRICVLLTDLLSNLPPNSHIQAFDVQQSKDLKVHLAFATKKDSNRSDLWVVAPFSIAHVLDLKSLPPTTVGTINSIHVGLTDVPDQQYPAIWLLAHPMDRTAIGTDVSRAEVSLDTNTVAVWKDLSLPKNVQKVLDIAPSSSEGLGRGLYFLYEHHGKVGLHVKFVRPGEERGDGVEWSQYDMPCPSTASSIASFVNYASDSNDSSLLLTSDEGLHLYQSQDTTENVDPILLTKASCFIGAKDLHVAQDDYQLSVWAHNFQDELGYLSGTIDNLSAARTATLLPSGRASSFTSLISRAEKNRPARHTLLTAGSGGNLTLLQQGLDTGIWREEPYYTEQGGDLVPVQSYTVNVVMTNGNDVPIRSGKVRLKTSSVQTITINGCLTTLDSRGTWCRLSAEGDLTLIIQTTGITSQPLEILEVQTLAGENLPVKGDKILDPSKLVIEGLASLTTPESLANATTKNSQKSLWDGQEKPSPEDMAGAAQCFQAITLGYNGLPSNGSILKPVVGAALGARTTALGVWDSVEELFMDGFHWIKEKIHDVTDWIIRKSGELWEFVCKIGGKVKKFVLDCMEKITEAASWVWEKLKLGWEKLCDFVGFVFSWDDILATKMSIKNMINAGFDFAAFKVESVNDKIDSFFGDIDEKVQKVMELQGSEHLKGLTSRSHSDDKEMNDYKNSPATKWVGERMKNGDVSMAAEGKVSRDPADIDLMQDRVMPLLASVMDLVDTLTKDIQALFQSDGEVSVDQMLLKLGTNLLSRALTVVKNTLKTIVTAVAKLVLLIKDIANCEVKSGFINGLWKRLNQGTNLSILDAVCLIIAIPTTLIIKLVTFARPPKLENIDRTFFDSKPSKDAAVIIMGSACGAATIKLAFNGIKLLYSYGSGGAAAGLASITPGTVMEVTSMVLDALSIYNDIMDPERPEGWTADLAFTCTIVKLCRLAISALHMSAGKLGLQNKVVDETKELFDVIAAVVVFGLDAGVFVGDMMGDGDKGDASISAVNTLLDTVSSIGYYTANVFKDKEPTTATTGLVVCEIAAAGVVITKGVEFRMRYSELQ